MPTPNHEPDPKWEDAFTALFAAEGPEDEVSPAVLASLERFWRALAQRYAKERDELRTALADGYFVEAVEVAKLRAIEGRLRAGRHTYGIANDLHLVLSGIADRKLVA